MFEGFIGLILAVGLIAAVIWFNARLTRMEREHKALLGFVLTSPTLGSKPEPASQPVHVSTEVAAQPPATAEISLLDTVPSEPPAPPVERTEPVAAAATAEPVVREAVPAPTSVPPVLGRPSRDLPPRDVETLSLIHI